MKKIAIILLAFILMVSTAACSKEEEKKVVRISISKSYGTTTSNIMKEYGILEKYLPDNYEVEWKFMTSSSDMRDALVAGQLNIVCTSLPTFITSYENGMPLALISFAGAVPIGLYGNDDTITSVADITTEDRIATKSKGNNGHIAFMIHNYMELGDAYTLDDNIAIIQEAEALALLQSSDEYVAGNFSFPYTVKAEEAGLHEIANYSQIIEDYGIGSTYFTTQDYYKENKEVIGALRAAQEEALQLIKDDKEGVAETLSTVFEVPKEDIITALEQTPPTNEYKGYDKLAGFLYEIGLVEHEPTKFSEMFNYEDLEVWSK